jgi:hypothetical protein
MAIENPPQAPGSGPAIKLQILSTEHWSLLATRSLTYSESLTRVSMFLSVMSGAVIALALIAQADRFGTTFIVIAILLLLVVLFVGVATIGRLMDLNRDDIRWVVGMNRLRHAYTQLNPGVEDFFVASAYDDLPGVWKTLGIDVMPGRDLRSVFHGFQTLPGMLTVIVSAVAGAIGALAALAFAFEQVAVVIATAAAFLTALILLGTWSASSFSRFSASLAARFPASQG